MTRVTAGADGSRNVSSNASRERHLRKALSLPFFITGTALLAASPAPVTNPSRVIGAVITAIVMRFVIKWAQKEGSSFRDAAAGTLRVVLVSCAACLAVYSFLFLCLSGIIGDGGGVIGLFVAALFSGVMVRSYFTGSAANGYRTELPASFTEMLMDFAPWMVRPGH